MADPPAPRAPPGPAPPGPAPPGPARPGPAPPGPARRGRTWAELLAGRAKRQKPRAERGQKLAAAGVQLLTRHLDLHSLLLEVELPRGESGLSQLAGSPETTADLSASLLGSALRDRACRLGLAVPDLASHVVAASVAQLCVEGAEPPPGVLLSPGSRERLASLLAAAQDLLARGSLSRPALCRALWRAQDSLLLEALWCLHAQDVVGLPELLESHPAAPAAVAWLLERLLRLCAQAATCCQPAAAGALLSDVVRVLVSSGFQDSDPRRDVEPERAPQVAAAVLQRMLAFALEALAASPEESAPSYRIVRGWLGVFSERTHQDIVWTGCPKRFFSHTLTQVLTHRPVLQVSHAVQKQQDWTFARAHPLLTGLFRELAAMLSAEELVGRLRDVVAAQEVNWAHVLSCVSVLLTCVPEARPLIQDWVDHLLASAFQSWDWDCMVTAFLVARQAALEGPSVAPSYADWFQTSFGSSRGHHGGSKKALVFLFKFLADLVPYEGPRYLQVHILRPPLVPDKYRALLTDYVSLARTRLADLKVPLESMGLYEDASSAGEIPEPHSRARQDVEKAVAVFAQTGRVPVTVMEASIFRRPYFASHFLPVLLSPRVLPPAPDAREALIEALRRADKIPPSLYSAYRQACTAAKDGAPDGAATGPGAGTRTEGPLGQLAAALDRLRATMAEPGQQGAVSAQMALVSERLSSALGPGKEGDSTEVSRIQLSVLTPELELQEQAVVDLLLTAFCQNLMVASRFAPPDRQGSWASSFVTTLCGRLLPAVLTRLCQLLWHQGPSLSASQILGLAALAVHLGAHRPALPEVCLDCPARSLPVCELFVQLLACRTAACWLFCLKFCTAAISYSLSKFAQSPDALRACLSPGLIKKFQFLVLRLLPEARGPLGREASPGPAWRSWRATPADWRRAALGLWGRDALRELLREPPLQLTYRDWLRMEAEAPAAGDCLSAAARRDFQCWAIHEHFLPAPAAAGGCDGDLEAACAALLDALLDAPLDAPLDVPPSPGNHVCEDGWASAPGGCSGNQELLSRLQEMAADLAPGGTPSGGHFLLPALRRRLQATEPPPGRWEAAAHLGRQQELLTYKRILLALPPALLLSSPGPGWPAAPNCADFFHLVNSELRNFCSHGVALTYDLTVHFFRGLLHACAQSGDPALTADLTLRACQAECPLLLTSAVAWWPRLEPELRCRWARCASGPLPPELQRLREAQLFGRSALLSDTTPAPAGPAWVSAAALHLSIQRAGPGSTLPQLDALGEELLLFLFFFCVTSLLASRLDPQATLSAQQALGVCAETLRCVQKRRLPWLGLFRVTEMDSSNLAWVLPRLAPDQLLRLLPLAFYSLLPYFDQDSLEGEDTFLPVAVDMYLKLTCLFVSGETGAAPAADGGRQDLQDEDSPVGLLMQARLFLLQMAPRCPRWSRTQAAELLATCGHRDPELSAALPSRQQATPAPEPNCLTHPSHCK